MSDEEYRAKMREALTEFGDEDTVDEAEWKSFADGIFYVAGEFKDAETYTRVKTRLKEIDEQRKTQGNRIFYLATAPEFFGLIADQLAQAKLARPEGRAWTRIIVEKPFGHDLESARALNNQLASVFEENQIYRIDHYLGKETVQNLLVFRFANSIFEPLWNHQYIDHVADHQCRGHRRRRPWRLLRKGGRVARHDAEPRLSARFVDRHGAASLS